MYNIKCQHHFLFRQHIVKHLLLLGDHCFRVRYLAGNDNSKYRLLYIDSLIPSTAVYLYIQYPVQWNRYAG